MNVATGLRRRQAAVVVSVVVKVGTTIVCKDRIRAHGSCSCGWEGVPHVLTAVAIHDAHIHAATSRCRPAVPLVL